MSGGRDNGRVRGRRMQKSEELKEGVNNTNSCTTTYEYALDLLLLE
ncbi:MAG: hypothetical protein WA421_07250 [Nitrososphaeraceae archaeon]